MATLLREHGNDKQAELVLRGMTMLNLADCPIRDDGAEIVAAFLNDDETVREVWLGVCDIGPRGGIALAEALKHNETLQDLDLNSNLIDDEGAEALIHAIVNYNVCIKVLDVSGNYVDFKLQATLDYLTETRNELLIPDAVRRASLYLIAARRSIADSGILSIFPKEIVKMIALEVWATRKDPKWIEAVSSPEHSSRQKESEKNYLRLCFGVEGSK